MKRTFNYLPYLMVAIAFFYLGVAFTATVAASAKPAYQNDEPYCTAVPGTPFTAIAVTATDTPTPLPAPPLPTNWPYTPTDTPSGDTARRK